jgi:hypothetical protein
MCDHLNEPDGTHAYLVARIAQLENELDECQLRSIEARNPGIDIEEVRRYRAAQKEAMKYVE